MVNVNEDSSYKKEFKQYKKGLIKFLKYLLKMSLQYKKLKKLF